MDGVTRDLGVGPGSMNGLRWLARIGPCPLDAWRHAMGWSEVAARSHARRLEREGWLARYPMTRGEGCLFMATRPGVSAAGVAAKPMRDESAPALWSHQCATAWAATWTHLRSREFRGPRELLTDTTWAMRLPYHDRQGYKEAWHRPALVVTVDGWSVCVEIAVQITSTQRLRGVMQRHSDWRWADRTGGVVYIVRDAAARERIIRAGRQAGLTTSGGGLRVELVETIRAEAAVTGERRRADRQARR